MVRNVLSVALGVGIASCGAGHVPEPSKSTTIGDANTPSSMGFSMAEVVGCSDGTTASPSPRARCPLA